MPSCIRAILIARNNLGDKRYDAVVNHVSCVKSVVKGLNKPLFVFYEPSCATPVAKRMASRARLGK
jgi:hypothetical protein